MSNQLTKQSNSESLSVIRGVESIEAFPLNDKNTDIWTVTVSVEHKGLVSTVVRSTDELSDLVEFVDALANDYALDKKLRINVKLSR